MKHLIRLAAPAFALLRPRQWVKNAFVLAPMFFSGAFLQTEAIRAGCFAALLFCIASSAAYVLNDILDVHKDRQHPEKARSRPIASGKISVKAAWATLLVLHVLTVIGCFLIPSIGWVVGTYVGLNLLYSIRLKHEPVIDIFCIATGFVLRVQAGAVAIGVAVSAWMFVTTLSLALYLASIKRRQELVNTGNDGRSVLEHYSVGLVDRYAEMSATGALVFYGLFVVSTRPALVVTIPLVLFGMFRYWYLADRLQGGESPTEALLGDWQLLVTLAAWTGLCAWALWPASSTL